VAGLHLVLAMHPAMLRCASCSEPLVHLEADPLGGPGHGASKTISLPTYRLFTWSGTGVLS
jgi:hypothetical protein